MGIFDEKYRVLAVETHRLMIRGVRSGEVLVIDSCELDRPLAAEDYPVGGLIALTDPSSPNPS